MHLRATILSTLCLCQYTALPLQSLLKLVGVPHLYHSCQSSNRPSCPKMASTIPSSLKRSRASRSLSTVMNSSTEHSHVTTLFSQSCCHASLISSELSSLYVEVPGSMVLVCLNAAFAKNFCTISFMPCHHGAAIIMAMLS